jgi:hypothetical protein
MAGIPLPTAACAVQCLQQAKADLYASRWGPRDLMRYQLPLTQAGALAKGRRSIRKSAMTPPVKSNAAHTYPHRGREARIGQRYTSHTCARPLLVPLLDTHIGERRTRTQTR